MEKFPMTREGLLSLEDERRRLKNEERPAVIKAIAEAREHGDLSENAEYHAARERQSFIEGRLAELEVIISRADVIDTSKLSGDMVRFGATVVVADEDTDEEEEEMEQVTGDEDEPIIPDDVNSEIEEPVEVDEPLNTEVTTRTPNFMAPEIDDDPVMR